MVSFRQRPFGKRDAALLPLASLPFFGGGVAVLRFGKEAHFLFNSQKEVEFWISFATISLTAARVLVGGQRRLLR